MMREQSLKHSVMQYYVAVDINNIQTLYCTSLYVIMNILCCH